MNVAVFHSLVRKQYHPYSWQRKNSPPSIDYCWSL